MLFVLYGVVLAILAGASWFAHLSLPPAKRLPISWGWRGRPCGYAPRLAALAFWPLLAAFVLGANLLMQDGSEGRRLEFAATCGAAIFGHLLYLFYLRLILRSLA